MSKITVTTIAGLTSGGDANKVKIESGDTLEVVNGSQTINRTGDGTTLTLQAGGTTFGTIGQDGSDLVIDGPSGHTGLRMTTSGLLPRQNGAIIDNTIDLGSGAYRYNDLYLGGGLYVGGTGASNHLDDYEEGTFTPTLTPSGGSYNGLTLTGFYRKIGSVVHVIMRLNITASGNASGSMTVGGLPFTSANLSSGLRIPNVWRENAATGAIGGFHINDNNTTGFLQDTSGSNVAHTTGRQYMINATYFSA